MKTMKNLCLFYLSALSMLALTSCRGQEEAGRTVIHDKPSGYTIITDTVRIKAQTYIAKSQMMRLNKVDLYHNRYVCLFWYHDYTGHIPELSLGQGYIILSLSRDGQDFEQIPTPTAGITEWNRGPLTIQVVNDTLYYFNRGFTTGSYWDETLQEWHTTDNIPPIRYEDEEDEEFTVKALPHGEFGDYVQFHEKNTGTNYLFETPLTKVIKYDSAFYLVEPIHIRKVSNPRRGWEMDDAIGYGMWYRYAPPAGIVINTRYRHLRIDYEFYEDHSQDTLFLSGFIRHDILHFLMRVMDEVFIARYKKSRHSTFEKVLSLGKIPLDEGYRSRQNKVLANFKQSWQMDGILDIADDTVRMTYLRLDYDSLSYLGTQVVGQVIDYVQRNLGVATMDSVRAFEERIGGYSDGDVVETNSKGFTTGAFADKMYGTDWFSRINNDQESGYERIGYHHILDAHDTFWVGYCYHQQTQVLTSLIAEFSRTEYMNGNQGEERLDFITLDSIITRTLSVPKDSVGKWIKNGKTYELEDSYKIRLYIR